MSNDSEAKKPIPLFQNEEDEREFWATHDSTEFMDWNEAKRIAFPKLVTSAKTISGKKGPISKIGPF